MIWGSVLGLTGRAECLCEPGWGQRAVGSAALLFFACPMAHEIKAQLSMAGAEQSPCPAAGVCCGKVLREGGTENGLKLS